MTETLVMWQNSTFDPTTNTTTLGPVLYFKRDIGGTCAQDDAVFNGLSPAAQLDQSVNVRPAGYQARDCSGTTTTTPTTPTTGTTTTTTTDDPALVTDLTDETNVQYFTPNQ